MSHYPQSFNYLCSFQESLESENTPDPMDAEQTWPTAEELQQAAENRKKKVIKVPKGFSEYQAAWIMEDAEGRRKRSFA